MCSLGNQEEPPDDQEAPWKKQILKLQIPDDVAQGSQLTLLIAINETGIKLGRTYPTPCLAFSTSFQRQEESILALSPAPALKHCS